MFIKKVGNNICMVDYLSLYREKNLKDLYSSLWDLDKRLRANLICEKKVSREDIDSYERDKTMLKKLYTKNLENIDKAMQLANEYSERQHLDTIHLEKKYRDIAKKLNLLESRITDIFYSMDKYFEFYKGDTKAYAYGSFENLVDALNSDPSFIKFLIDEVNLDSNFNYKLSSREHLEFLDGLSHPYLSILRGIYEFLNQNDLIDLTSLDKRSQIAGEIANNFFGYHNGYNTPEAPKILVYNKPNGKIFEQLSFPKFFEFLDKYLHDKLRSSGKSGKDSFDDKIEIISDEKSFLDPGNKEYMRMVLGNGK